MSPVTSPRGRGRPGAPTKFSLVLAGAGAAYVATFALSAGSTSPSLWGVNLAAFLPPAQRAALLGAATLGVALLVWAAVRPSAAVHPSRSAERPRSGAATAAVPFLALPVLAVLFSSLRTRTHFLGDGIVWLANLTSGQFPKFSEPLAGEVWHGYVAVLRWLGLRPDAPSLAVLPVVCGLVTAVLLWLLARAIAPGRRSPLLVAFLLITLGVSQLYFGYIESYPIVCVFVTGYLLAGVHGWTSRRFDVRPGVALALATSAHIVSLTLVPSYVALVARARVSTPRKAILLAVPVALAAALFTGLRFGIHDLLRPFQAVGAALQGGSGSFGFTWRSVLSARRWIDLANIALLLAPVPLILLAASAGSGLGRAPARPRPSAVSSHDSSIRITMETPLGFLALAAAPGLLAALFLVVPSSPAQDWDLLAVVLLPAAVAAVAAGLPSMQRVPTFAAAGLGMLALVGLFSFVLVNASETAGIRRFESLLAEPVELRPHERAYGNEKLATYWAERGDYDRALVYAKRAVEAEPTNPRYWVKAGGALVSLGRHAEAIPYLTEGLRREPGRGDASYDLGICYAKENRYRDAVGAFQAAVAADGNRPDYRHNLGVALYASGDTDSARLVWTEVLRRWEGYPLTVRSMARRSDAGVDTSNAATPRP